MKATARRTDGYKHQILVRGHELLIDEPTEEGGDDAAPSPQEMLAASLASCVAITIEMYSERKGWDVSGLEVDCDYTPAERGAVTRFEMTIRVPSHLDEEQRERIRVIAAKCPVHRTLEGEVEFEERVETQP